MALREIRKYQKAPTCSRAAALPAAGQGDCEDFKTDLRFGSQTMYASRRRPRATWSTCLRRNLAIRQARDHHAQDIQLARRIRGERA